MGKLSHNVLLYVIFSHVAVFEKLDTFLPNLHSGVAVMEMCLRV